MDLNEAKYGSLIISDFYLHIYSVFKENEHWNLEELYCPVTTAKISKYGYSKNVDRK